MKTKTFNITKSEDRASHSLNLLLEGDLSINNAAAIVKYLKGLKFSDNSVAFHLKNVEKLDLTTVQVLFSLRNTLKVKERKISIVADLPTDLQKLLNNTGLILN
jgi:ABC-type transporter Mla MlaB component